MFFMEWWMVYNLLKPNNHRGMVGNSCQLSQFSEAETDKSLKPSGSQSMRPSQKQNKAGCGRAHL